MSDLPLDARSPSPRSGHRRPLRSVSDVLWARVDDDAARVIVHLGTLSHAVDMTVDDKSGPVVVLQWWRNASAGKEFQLQPFGAVISDFRYVGGYRLPFRAKAGIIFEADGYFPFLRAKVTKTGFSMSNVLTAVT